MQSKQKGNIGVSQVVLCLQKNGFNVFSELGDYSKIDLIAEKDGVLRTIQVKYVTRVNDSLRLPVRKCGPNGYRYSYQSNDTDWFAMYDPESENVFWVKSAEACSNRTQFTLRLNKSKNNQTKNVNFADNYSIAGFLRDYTQNACNGEDIVQTTTRNAVNES